MSLAQVHAGFWLFMGALLCLVAIRAVLTLKDALLDRDWRSTGWAIAAFLGALLAGAILMAMGMDSLFPAD